MIVLRSLRGVSLIASDSARIGRLTRLQFRQPVDRPLELRPQVDELVDEVIVLAIEFLDLLLQLPDRTMLILLGLLQQYLVDIVPGYINLGPRGLLCGQRLWMRRHRVRR